MFATTQHPTTIQQARTTARVAARRVPRSTRPLYRQSQTTLDKLCRRVGVLCQTQSDNPQALTYDLMRLEQALYQSLRLQRSMKQRRRQRK